MTFKEAIARADALRPNSAEERLKVSWLAGLEAMLKEIMSNGFRDRPTPPPADGFDPLDMGMPPPPPPVPVTPPETVDVTELDTRELALPFPWDNVYVYFLAAQNDYYNQEFDLYANDMAVYTQELADFRGWWRRHNQAAPTGNWRV